MLRLTVALLAAFDAVIAVAVGLAATLAPLTLLWVFSAGQTPDWSALWPAAAVVWQFGNLTPVHVELAGDYLAATGIAAEAASFTLSLAPLAFASFTAIFAARSGVRASRAEAWATGVSTAVAVFAVASTLVALTSHLAVASVALWQAVLFPTLVFALPALAGAAVTEWREAGTGRIARVRDRVEAWRGGWGEVPGLAVRGSAAAVAGLVGLGALMTAVGLVFGGGDVIALFEAGGVDVIGAIVVALGQLAYLPTVFVWGLAFVAGPGFAIGSDTSVSPASTQVGVLPGIPLLGIVPETTSPFMLAIVLLPVGIGALAGWIVRSRLVAGGHDGFGPRTALTAAIAVLAGAAAAGMAALASGSIGPGSLSFVGPQAGPVAVAVGLEVALGVGILLLSPARHTDAVEAAVTEPVMGSATDAVIEAVTEPIVLPELDDLGKGGGGTTVD